MATTVHEPPKIDPHRLPEQPRSGNGGWRNQVPPAAVPRARLLRQTVGVDFWRFVYCSCHNLLNSRLAYTNVVHERENSVVPPGLEPPGPLFPSAEALG